MISLVPVASVASVTVGLYAYVLPFVLLATWAALAVWDVGRREDLSRGSAVGWAIAAVAVPFVGAAAYLAAGRSAIPAYLRAAVVLGGIAAYALVYGVGELLGGVA